jgi:probable rRNA maturation factor
MVSASLIGSFLAKSKILFLFHPELTLTVSRLELLKKHALRVFEAEKKGGLINIIFTTDEHQRSLNLEFRGLDKTTDVLSFNWDEPDLLGEIYISVPQIQRQAPKFGATIYAETKRMLTHGILHLCGYDHKKPADRKIMRQKEDTWI